MKRNFAKISAICGSKSIIDDVGEKSIKRIGRIVPDPQFEAMLENSPEAMRFQKLFQEAHLRVRNSTTFSEIHQSPTG